MNGMNTRHLAAAGGLAALVCTFAFAVGGGGSSKLSQAGTSGLDSGDHLIPSKADNGGEPVVIDDGDLYPPVAIDPTAFDLDDDSVVAAGDLIAVILAWGTVGESAADFNNDGMVDAADIGLLLAAYGMPAGAAQDSQGKSTDVLHKPTDHGNESAD